MNFEKLKQIASKKWEEITNPSKVLIFIVWEPVEKLQEQKELKQNYLSAAGRKKLINVDVDFYAKKN
ncbi:MAG: hypothetical protein QME68_01025 [Elusimicrobiota bacterium]|nr:hypothetical protein [Elusimicrobiota bacterium]